MAVHVDVFPSRVGQVELRRPGRMPMVVECRVNGELLCFYMVPSGQQVSVRVDPRLVHRVSMGWNCDGKWTTQPSVSPPVLPPADG